jgi:poly-beta-1,6-N-acetyl-D-glucosamine N-deacetylase
VQPRLRAACAAFCLLLWCLGCAAAAGAGMPANATPAAVVPGSIAPGQRFVSVAFHDVVDDPAQLDADAVTTDRLVAFFDHLRGAGWTAVSLDDIEAARRGIKPLPERAILITFDDGYASLYTRVFPLALAYRMPVVAALVTGWMQAAPGTTVTYGDQQVPREKFVTWAQVREMQASGLIEFASHSHDLHRGVIGNPQGNSMPAAVTRLYGDGRYETELEHRQRVADDLRTSRDLIARQTGVAPRTLVWPFGRYSANAVEVAQSLGYRFALTLDPEPADAALPMALSRYLPTHDPKLAEIDINLRYVEELPAATRFACVDPAALWTGDLAGTDEQLGKLIERLRKLGATAVVIDAAKAGADGRLQAAWFPNTQLPLQADLLSRLAWQIQTRAGVQAFVRLPAAAARATLGSDERVRALFRELGVMVPASGLWLDGTPALVAQGAAPGEGGAMPWQTYRQRRDFNATGLPEADALALAAFHEAERARPRLRLALAAAPGTPAVPSALADTTWFPVPADAAPDASPGAPLAAMPGAARVQALTMQRPAGINPARRTGLVWAGDTAVPAEPLGAAVRALQVGGGSAFGWCPDVLASDEPAALRVAPDVSASRFPLRP